MKANIAFAIGIQLRICISGNPLIAIIISAYCVISNLLQKHVVSGGFDGPAIAAQN